MCFTHCGGNNHFRHLTTKNFITLVSKGGFRGRIPLDLTDLCKSSVANSLGCQQTRPARGHMPGPPKKTLPIVQSLRYASKGEAGDRLLNNPAFSVPCFAFARSRSRCEILISMRLSASGLGLVKLL